MKHRVVSVGHRRNMNRFLAIVGVACADAGVTPEQSTRICLMVAQQMAEEGYILTRQVA
jgi:hypothetical protein